MAFVPALLGGLSALGGLFGNRGSTTRQTETTDTTGTQSGTSGFSGASSSNPVLDPRASGLLDQILSQYMNALKGTDLSGYEASGVSGINRQSDISKQNIEENAAARGVFGPAVATAQAGNEVNRGQQINQFRAGVPLIQNQLLQQVLGLGGNLFSSIPRGTYNEQYGGSTESQTSTQHGTQTGSVTQPGNMLGGLFGGLGNTLAYLYGRGAFGGVGGTH